MYSKPKNLLRGFSSFAYSLHFISTPEGGLFELSAKEAKIRNFYTKLERNKFFRVTWFCNALIHHSSKH